MNIPVSCLDIINWLISDALERVVVEKPKILLNAVTNP